MQGINKIIVAVAALVTAGGLQATDITLAEQGDLSTGGHYKIMMICRKDTDVKGTISKANRAGENWYGEQEKELYKKHHDPDNDKFVYFVGEHYGPKVNKTPGVGGADPSFKQDHKASPAECRLYFVVKY